MKIERIVFGPTARFMAHLTKQGIAFREEYDKRYTEQIDGIHFIIETTNYKPYTKNNGFVGLSEGFRELGTKKWKVK